MDDLDLVAIGERIQSVRGDVTQKDFAARLGIGRTSVVRYESGQRKPDALFVARLYAVFGINPVWLLTGEGVISPHDTLKPDEAILLDNYRNSPMEGKDAIKRAAFALAKHQKEAAFILTELAVCCAVMAFLPMLTGTVWGVCVGLVAGIFYFVGLGRYCRDRLFSFEREGKNATLHRSYPSPRRACQQCRRALRI
jgi:transcriptional regulator with XRE-family HTH domain